MEIKATLQKPYKENDRLDFIVKYNHTLGYIIEETETELQALGYTDEELEQQEKERISMLNMTRGDFIEGLILAQGKDETDIIALIEQLPITDMEKKVYINRVKNALDFYRGYPVIDVLAGYLNVTPGQMDLFFKTKDYKHLIPIEAENENTTNAEQ